MQQLGGLDPICFQAFAITCANSPVPYGSPYVLIFRSEAQPALTQQPGKGRWNGLPLPGCFCIYKVFRTLLISPPWIHKRKTNIGTASCERINSRVDRIDHILNPGVHRSKAETVAGKESGAVCCVDADIFDLNVALQQGFMAKTVRTFQDTACRLLGNVNRMIP